MSVAPRGRHARRRRGSALLAVLWLSAALAAIAFSLASTVRGETERAATSVESLRSYYLAQGGIYRAALELLWSSRMAPDQKIIPRFSVTVHYRFATGDVDVDFLPEAGKLDVNSATPEVLYRLCLALGVEPERAQLISTGIELWRRPGEPGKTGQNPASGPSFQIVHASIQEIEELLQVQGVTPDIFYGTYVPAPEGSGGPRLRARAGLVDCLSVFGSRDRIDANTAQPAVLSAIGLPPASVNALLERRRQVPFTEQTLSDFLQTIETAGAPLRVEGNSIVTMRATARLRTAGGHLSDLRRTVAAQVKYMPPGYDSPIHILRWYDTAGIN